MERRKKSLPNDSESSLRSDDQNIVASSATDTPSKGSQLTISISDQRSKRVKTVAPSTRQRRRSSRIPGRRRSKGASVSVSTSDNELLDEDADTIKKLGRGGRVARRKSTGRSFVRYVDRPKTSEVAVRKHSTAKPLRGIMKKPNLGHRDTIFSKPSSSFSDKAEQPETLIKDVVLPDEDHVVEDAAALVYVVKDEVPDDRREKGTKTPPEVVKLSKETISTVGSSREEVHGPVTAPPDGSSEDSFGLKWRTAEVSLEDDMFATVPDPPPPPLRSLRYNSSSYTKPVLSADDLRKSTINDDNVPSPTPDRKPPSFIDRIIKGNIERHFDRPSSIPSCRYCARKRSVAPRPVLIEEEDEEQVEKDEDAASWPLSLDSDTTRSPRSSSRRSASRSSGPFESSFALQLSSAVVNKPLVDFIENQDGQFLTFKWHFLDKEEKHEFWYTGENEIGLKYKKKYSFFMDEGVYLYLDKIGLRFELYITNSEDEEVIIGRADLKLGVALDRVGERFKATLPIGNRDLSCCYGIKKESFGELVCKYGFLGDADSYRKYAPRALDVEIPPPRGSGSFGDLLVQSSPTSSKYGDKSHSGLLRTPDFEQQALQDGLGLLLSRNKALHTTQDEIADELTERAGWLHRELQWKVTLQEFAILSGHDPFSVKWRMWRDEHTEHVKYHPYGNPGYKGRALIEIHLEELYLYQGTSVITDDSITQIYLEFTFLNFEQCETDTLPKPTEDSSLVFDWQEQFTLVEDTAESRRYAELIRNQEMLVVSAVAQPYETADMVRSCFDFGYAEVNFFDLLQYRTDWHTSHYTVFDSYTHQEIGVLKASVDGLNDARSLALYELRPDTFK